MNSRLVVVQILIIPHGAFHSCVQSLEAVRLGQECVRVTIPRNEMAEEDASHANLGQLIIARVGIGYEMTLLDSVHPDQIGHTKTEKAPKFLEPATVEHVTRLGRGRTPVLVL